MLKGLTLDMTMSFKIRSLLLLMLSVLSTHSMADALQESTKIWSNLRLTGPISEDKTWGYYVEPQLRFIDNEYKFNQINLYAGFYKNVSDSTSLWLGVMRRYEQKSDGDIFLENRIWEQLVADLITKDNVEFVSRSRLEQRKNVDSTKLANRFRQRFTLKLPLSLGPRYYFVIADEMFIQLNQPDWVSQRVFSENRAAIGIEGPINKVASYEVGYLNQYQFGNPNQMGNVVYFNLVVKM